MTASTLNSAVSAFSVPGVYELPRPRPAAQLPIRTDVAGFVGFEPRVRDGTTPSTLIGATPTGHIFRIDVATFQVEIRGRSVWVPGRRDVVVSADPATTLIADKETTVFAIAVATRYGTSHLVITRSTTTPNAAPSDDEVRAEVLARFADEKKRDRHDRKAPDGAEHDWLRIADVRFEREGRQIWTTAHPALTVTRCDEWRDYLRAFGGFIGFEPHVRAGSLPSTLTGSPPTGHAFRVDVDTFQVEIAGRTVWVPGGRGIIVSEDPAAPLLTTDGSRIVFAIVVAVRLGTPLLVFAHSTTTPTAAPTDDEVSAAVAASAWLRIANVYYERRGEQVETTIFPIASDHRCSAGRQSTFASASVNEDGTYLASAVRAFFANGGGRCYVVTVRRTVLVESNTDRLDLARREMIGIAGSSLEHATGLERLLLIEEVGIVDLPDLHARRVSVSPDSFRLPPSERDVCFAACPPAAAPAAALAERAVERSEPLWSSDHIFYSQRDLVARCMSLRWRVLALLSPPLEKGSSEFYEPPSVEDAEAWRVRFLQDLTLGSGDDSEAHRLSCAAMYFPWVQVQEGLDAPLKLLPPTPFAAGVMARRDLARGPHVAPANEPLVSVIALSPALSDEQLGRLYEPPADTNGSEVPGINAFRATPGRGLLIWGARTLSTDKWLRYVPVRRCLSAIERRCKVGLDAMVFEPNSPITWAQTTQLVLGVLHAVYERGGLRGATPAEAFYIRCDETVNPPESVQAGILNCEVGVAIAAPAEFIVFQLGRQEGVTEITE